MLRVIIIDDIDSVRKENRIAIETHCPQLQIIAEANSVKSGIEAIKKYQPNLVFLDVEMADGTGFDLLKQIQSITFKVIFVSGHESFAVKAFKHSAIDYLLKPINGKELVVAVNKVQEVVETENFNLKISTLLSNLERPKNLQKLILKTAEKIFSVNIQDIVHCEGETNYTTFYTVDGSKIVVSKNLKEYEISLIDLGFFRPHQSHLINMAYFDHFIKNDGGTIVMKNKAQIPLSQRKKVEFMALLDAM